jgi:DNA polymerase-3 subunit alpha
MSLSYTSLHNHSTFSLYDGLGFPSDFFDYVLKNGGDSFALTEHGSMNSMGYAITAAKALKAKGAKFRAIYGVEAYYHPSLDDWRIAYNQDDVDNDTVIENEQESKERKWYDPVKRRHHLVLFALNRTGLQNLFSLVSLSYRRENFYRFPRIDNEMLRKFNDGVGMSTACLAGMPTWLSLQNPEASTHEIMGLYDKELLPLLEIFGKDRAFLELQFNALPEQTVVNQNLIQYANHSGYKLIVASDAHYCRPDLWREREIYKTLGRQMMGTSVDVDKIPKAVEDLKCELYPHNADQIFAAYQKYFQPHCQDQQLVKDAINRTHDIAWQLIDHVEPDSTIKLPRFVSLPGKALTPFDQLKQHCIDGLKQRGLGKNQEYVQRTIFELQIIKDKNVSEYFLTKKGILDALRKHLLLGTGRGSGAGSMVNYLLGITMADPIAGDLLFERFISPSRAELPDIDSDCEDKDQAFEILKEAFGADDTLAISNYNTLKLKSLVKDVARLYNIPFDEVNNITRVMEEEARGPIMDSIGHDQKLYDFTFENAYQHSLTFRRFIDTHPEVGECLAKLYRAVKAIGRHAGGVLIVPEASKHLPIIRVRNVSQSPFTEGLTAQHLKHFGLVKFDVLGLTTLKIIRRCIELVLQKAGNPTPTIDDVWNFYNSKLHPDVIDPADQKVFKKVYCEGRFPSIFQFAEPRVQAFCQQAKPASVKDLSALTALYRPGPLKGQADKRYLEATERELTFDHPVLEEVLGDTRGVLLYQEQFMLLANKLAGFSLDEADKLRKLLVKPSHELGEEMKQQRLDVSEKFIAGCVEKGLTVSRATHLWEKEILGFISYGFNKSHSYVYAYNSYQCAWLYTHHEQEWIKACLEKDPDLGRTVRVVTSLGYSICKPDINFSLADQWQISGNQCIPPLNAIKGIGMTAAEELVQVRSSLEHGFLDFQHLLYNIDEQGLQRWRWSKFNKKAFAALMQVEAFDSLQAVGSLFGNYRHMHDVVLANFDLLRKGFTKEGRGKKAIATNVQLDSIATETTEDWPRSQKICQQKELLGVFDPRLLFSPEALTVIDKYDIKPLGEIGEQPASHWFVVKSVEVKTSRNGKRFRALKISDEQGAPAYVNYFLDAPAVCEEEIYAATMHRDERWITITGKMIALNQQE